MVVTDCQDCEKNPFGFIPHRKVHWQWHFFLRYCTLFNRRILLVSGPTIRKCFPPRIWCCATAKHKWYCCQITVFLLWLFVAAVGDTTTILGFFFFSLYQKPCSSCGVNSQLSLFSSLLVLQPEVLVDQEWRSKKSCLKICPRHLLVLRK